ncbi:hypothetical protein [Methylosinus sp. PW1]|uniref:hypothetical protein n=1 Tax=Methylosinus sp. PW1 TaxID=107636 RepID=UPI00055F2309|nr:hypothetical protein [Methylosinus sp. PW1]
MADLNHVFGEDLSFGPSNDLATVDGSDLGHQRIIRRLMTAVRGYVWHGDYGAGVPQQIGLAEDYFEIQSAVMSQIRKEAAVASTPVPDVSVTGILNGVRCDVTYWDADTGDQRFLSFDVAK